MSQGVWCDILGNARGFGIKFNDALDRAGRKGFPFFAVFFCWIVRSKKIGGQVAPTFEVCFESRFRVV